MSRRPRGARRAAALAGAGALILLTGAAAARTLHVPGEFADVQAALDAAATGDEVLVGPGTWPGALTIRDKHVHLRAAAGPSATALLGGELYAVRLIGGGEVSGFTIVNRDRVYGAAFVCDGAGPIVRGNVIVGERDDPLAFGAGVASSSTDVLIEGNVFRDNACFQGALLAFGNVAGGAAPPRVLNNVIVDNDCPAIDPGRGPLLIANNTVVGNRGGLIAIYATATVVLRNNLFVGNGVGLDITPSGRGDPLVARNLFFANGVDFPEWAPPAADNLFVDARLVDAPSGDLRLAADSPAIDAGLAEDAPARDFDGKPRPLDGDGDGTAAVDLGAYERAAASACHGDCDRDRHVTIAELVRIVAIALGERPLTDCAAVDADSDGRLTIDETVRAVAAALDGCGDPDA